MSLFAILLAISALSAHAEIIQLTDIPAQPLGTHVHYLVEEDRPLGLAQAMAHQDAGRFHPGQQRVLNFGIGSRPVWIYLGVNNPTDSTLQTYLVGGVTWLDQVEVYVVRSGQLQKHVHTGDEVLGAEGLAPAIGYALPLHFAPGRTDIYLRIDSVDPMALPIELLTKTQLEERQRAFGYFYGFFYGFLAALCIYNFLLFTGLRERSYLYYSLALISVIACNFGYTGHGLAWLWSGQPWFQRYVVLDLMVGYGCLGMLFANRFLSLAEDAPRVQRAMRWYAGFGLGTMTLAMLAGSHLLAALVAFAFLPLFTFGMILLGVWAVRQGQIAGRYFLSAMVFGLAGVAITDLAVWGKIPYTPVTFHAFEIGISLEAILLAMALAYKIRQYQQAEQIARQDPLTGLHNRRAFLELAAPCMNSAERGQRPVSLIMMDIDHFKQINDQYGHRAGDEVLVAVADLLRKHSRTSDIVARWGGEEFILLLTETDQAHAFAYAERLRQAISEIRVAVGSGSISLTASFGVAERTSGTVLDDLVQMADVSLYKAKGEGRNRVSAESFA